MTRNHTLRRDPKGSRSVGTGWEERPWYGRERGFGGPYNDGDRPTLTMQGDADDIRAIGEAVRAELAARAPEAIVHVTFDTPNPCYGKVSIELHGDAIGLPNNGPTHRSRKMDLMRILRWHAVGVTDEWNREIREDDERRFLRMKGG